MSLLEKLQKNSKLVDAAQLDESKVYGTGDMVTTPYPIINIALGGSADGGLTPGIHMIAGPSKHFKTMFMLLLAKAYLTKYPEAVILFYDSEFGTNDAYFEMFDIPKDRVIHCPVTNIEEFKNDIVNQLEALKKGDKVFIMIDSLGNLASKKEVDDAIEGKTVADMTRAKALKSLGRLITPHLVIKDIPCVVINHTYKEIGMFPKDIVGGGTGMYYSSNAIWIIGRQQNKDGTVVEGYNFIITIEKSRYVREKSKLPLEVNFETGINKWSGMFDLALELGIIESVSKQLYKVVGTEDTFKKSAVKDDDAFWQNVFKTTDFGNKIQERFKL